MEQRRRQYAIAHLSIAAIAFAVLCWRLAALCWPSSLITLPDSLRLPIGVMGLVFLTCGLVAWWVRPGRWTGIFLLYGIGGGVHWGGAIGTTSEATELAMFFVYLTLTALADAALLHLAIVFPSGKRVGLPMKALLYAPAGVALAMVPGALVASQDSLEVVAGLLLLVTNLFTLAAGVVFIVSLAGADRATRNAAHLPQIVATMVTATIVALLGAAGVLPGEPEAWNLVLGAIPICLAFALASPARAALNESVAAA